MITKEFENQLMKAMAVAKEYSHREPEAFDKAARDYARKMFYSIVDDGATYADIITAACFTIFVAVSVVEEIEQEGKGVH